MKTIDEIINELSNAEIIQCAKEILCCQEYGSYPKDAFMFKVLKYAQDEGHSFFSIRHILEECIKDLALKQFVNSSGTQENFDRIKIAPNVRNSGRPK